MNSTFYLERNLTHDDRIYTETELLATSKYIVVLAEPGGGKTELMKSLALKLNTSVINASFFAHVGAEKENSPLVIDAVDEVARIDQSGLHKLLARARTSKPTSVIMSSRSSEWGLASTGNFERFLGFSPMVVRLREFNQDEQRAIFKYHAPEEDFFAFQTEVTRFSLEMLLPNPQFLKMFTDAYLESGRCFADKRSIFALAVERLAKEVNPNFPKASISLSVTQKISFSAEVYVKLLLSGAEGVSTIDATANRMYPTLSALFSGNTACYDILSTQLFKPGDKEDQHCSVHKIVAEYCAAGYLVKRIADPADVLTLTKCLPVIAPNGAVRDELRGLLGWMAALGNKSVQESIIELDAYAVLANGDPSQLERSSKRLLLSRLKEIEAADPYFRRSDFWRRFSAAGFFTQDVVEEIKPLLMMSSEGHLRGLILELLADSPVNFKLAPELSLLYLNSNESESIRKLASKCLLNIDNYEFAGDLAVLIFEASNISLDIAANIIEVIGPENFNHKYLSGFLRVCANLYPGHKEQLERVVGTRYFIKRLISCFSLHTIGLLLDELTRNLYCHCGKESYECDCRNGISKIVGSMVDRYFELTQTQLDPAKIWQWIGNLNFHHQCQADQSKSVQVLRENHMLRQEIIAHVFGPLTDREEIFSIKVEKFDGQLHSHSGLNLWRNDYKFILNLAFAIDNADLWASFLVSHQRYRKKEEQGPDDLRAQMRRHALSKPAFMREWSRFNNAMKLSERKHQHLRFRHSRKMNRYDRRQREIHAKNIEFVNENRDIVERGLHWGCLVRFAELVLMLPERIELEFGDDKLVRGALRNCLDFIASKVPTLPELATLQCESKYRYSETILYAACLEILRAEGNLESVNIELLTALRTNIHMGYNSVSTEERDALQAEIDRIIFPDSESAEKYLRQYVEPQLSQPCPHPEIWMLSGEEVFSHSRAKLSIEWLCRFTNLPLDSVDKLFEIAAQYGERENLIEIIEKFCANIMSEWPNPTDNENIERKRIFWLVREFYFLDNITDIYWAWLRSNKDNLLHFYKYSGHMSRSENHAWPELTSIKVEAILDAFIEQWPRVELPDLWGSNSPKEEKAYRFLNELIWFINSDIPDEAIPVLGRLLNNPRFASLHKELQSIYSTQIRKKALRDFEPPTPDEIVQRLDCNSVVTVEDLRQLVLQELNDFQKAIDGGEFNSADRFYEKNERLDEVKSTEIIAERLNLRLEPQGISITPEHQLKDQNRSDFTASKLIGGKRRLLVTEVKGQWHRELYSAASAQLYDRYSIHPDAEQQGIFLVIWFGSNEIVAGRKNHGIKTAQELKTHIETVLPIDLRGLIDVFVLNVSRESHSKY
ncbi:hypothetical protein OIT20_000226 [Salmonella enterica]|uniref:Uncharacterized protein n=2 Tax=Salmonella enterica TaxID=28901 RepID=A0A600JBM2_SALET|nr:hypothetical protein [Salmonella enterica]ECT3106001.1 hypothetical protein [Salmonella enterica subsp. enterica serovar Bareilly]EBI1907551.1 hypothetical protein [Salmonella enterica]EBO4253708.1 hypothetical protein [Salmonella enterica]EGR6782000.1 hypothetical protein [Salmonella enterica]EIN7564103.1 hypothetical protein [Salmonella enterica]